MVVVVGSQQRQQQLVEAASRQLALTLLIVSSWLLLTTILITNMAVSLANMHKTPREEKCVAKSTQYSGISTICQLGQSLGSKGIFIDSLGFLPCSSDLSCYHSLPQSIGPFAASQALAIMKLNQGLNTESVV